MCHSTEYDHLIPEPAETPSFLAAFPRVEDAETFARTLVFGQRGRVACERPSFDPYWCIVHSHDFADGAGACEAAR